MQACAKAAAGAAGRDASTVADDLRPRVLSLHPIVSCVGFEWSPVRGRAVFAEFFTCDGVGTRRQRIPCAERCISYERNSVSPFPQHCLCL